MKKSILASLILVLTLGLTACEGVSNQTVGLVGGGVAGGVIGSAVSGGSAVGTGIGAVGGALVGYQVGKHYQ